MDTDTLSVRSPATATDWPVTECRERLTARRALKPHLDPSAATLVREIVAQQTSQAEAVARALVDSGEPGARPLPKRQLGNRSMQIKDSQTSTKPSGRFTISRRPGRR